MSEAEVGERLKTLALKVQEGATSQDMPLETGKGKEMDSPQSLQKERNPVTDSGPWTL